ncbi:MAG: aminomethyl transferase family protein, partial [Candidatus Eisenbacteria bacterium]
MLKTSPFHPRTAPLVRAQTWRRWSGYQMASAYDPHPDREYAAIRSSAALIDVSPLYKYRIQGKDAVRLLDRTITRDMTKLKPGQVYYTPWCDAEGKVIDDGTVTNLGGGGYRLTSADSSFRWLHMNAVGLEVEIEDISERVGALSIQGPLSRAILSAATGADLSSLKYFRMIETRVRDTPVAVSRTGYTGDLGYEVWVDAARAVQLWDALMEAGKPYGITPTGVWGMDIARIEAGLILIEVDYMSSKKALIDSQKYSPFEIGLGKLVDLKKENFVGRDALAQEAKKGSERALVGLEIIWNEVEALYD